MRSDWIQYDGDGDNTDGSDKLFPVEITGSTLGDDGIWYYQWQELEADTATGQYSPMVDGRVGDYIPAVGTEPESGAQPAYELNNQEVADGTVVWLLLRTTQLGFLAYEFSAGVSGGDGGGDKCDTLFDACPVVNGYGQVTGIRKTFVRGDGSSYCITADTCNTTCPVLWYCTSTGGLVSVAVGSDPPENWIKGRGPYRSQAEAAAGLATCKCSIPVTCGSLHFNFPSGLTFTLANASGAWFSNGSKYVPAFIPESSFDNPLCEAVYGYDIHTLVPFPCPNFNPYGFQFIISATASPGPPFWTPNLNESAIFTCGNGPIDPGYIPPPGCLTFTGANGFSQGFSGATGTNAIRTIAGTDGTISGPLFVGTVRHHLPDNSVDGQADVYVQ